MLKMMTIMTKKGNKTNERCKKKKKIKKKKNKNKRSWSVPVTTHNERTKSKEANVTCTLTCPENIDEGTGQTRAGLQSGQGDPVTRLTSSNATSVVSPGSVRSPSSSPASVGHTAGRQRRLVFRWLSINHCGLNQRLMPATRKLSER